MEQLELPFKETPDHWKSQARIAGEAGEIWCSNNLNCPICDNGELEEYETNFPVKDFSCSNCDEDFQLKTSKTASPDSGESITSSSFEKWYNAILDERQPSLLILKYELTDSKPLEDSKENTFQIDKNTVSLRGYRIFKKTGFVDKVFLIKKEDIDEECLVKRDKLSKVARRNGWEGSYLKIDGNKFTQIFPEDNNE